MFNFIYMNVQLNLLTGLREDIHITFYSAFCVFATLKNSSASILPDIIFF